MTAPHSDAVKHATETFARTLKGSDVITKTVSDDIVLVPVIATRHGLCSLCRSYIEPGEMVVIVPGEWTHEVCARQHGCPIA